SSPSGISCRSGSGDCEENFPGGTTVTLEASPDQNSTFTGWTGCQNIVDGDCVVELTADRAVTATFVSSAPACVDGTGNAAELIAAVAWANSNGQDDVLNLGANC